MNQKGAVMESTQVKIPIEILLLNGLLDMGVIDQTIYDLTLQQLRKELKEKSEQQSETNTARQP